MKPTKETEELSLNKEEIISLAKNIETQYLTFAEMVETRLAQTIFISEGLEKYSLKDFVSSKTVNDIAVALHGLIVNMEDIKSLIININNQYPELYKKYSDFLEISENNIENVDLDLLGANIIDIMQPYLKATTDASNKIDILTETYTTEVQVKLETIINTLAKANIHLDKLESIEAEIKEDIKNTGEEDGIK